MLRNPSGIGRPRPQQCWSLQRPLPESEAEKGKVAATVLAQCHEDLPVNFCPGGTLDNSPGVSISTPVFARQRTSPDPLRWRDSAARETTEKFDCFTLGIECSAAPRR